MGALHTAFAKKFANLVRVDVILVTTTTTTGTTAQPNNARRRASTSQSQYAVVVVLASDTSADEQSVSASMTTFVDTELKPALQGQGLCSSKNPCALTSPKKIASITTTTGTDA